MPVLALPAFWAAVAGGTTAASMAVQASAASHAADVNADAQRNATAAQSKAATDTLAFQQSEAGRQHTADEVNRRADYDQWAAREARIGSLGQSLGLPARQIPGYAALPQGGTSSAMSAGPNSGAASDPLLALAKSATAKGLRGQAAVDWINTQQPGAAVVVKAGDASPPGKLVWYDKGTLPNGQPSGKFQVAGQWEYRDDPSSWVNGSPTQYQLNPLTGGATANPLAMKRTPPYGSLSAAAPSPQTPAYVAPTIALPSSASRGSIRFLTDPGIAR